jgi:pimeloyl-ACP methyl ester carboxylesterase
MLEIIIGALGAGGAVVALSYLVERLRRPPPTPTSLSWAPEVPVRWVTVDGIRLRYAVAGSGPPLVLLHTLRTQLDLFQRVFPTLAARYRVYAVDLPGHGHSGIPAADYTAEFFIGKIAGFLDRLEIDGAVLVGESIGGTVALALAARRHPRVRAAVAINPYDYDRGRGTMRSSPLARLLFSLNDVPVLGGTVMRLRQLPVITAVLEGGLYRLKSLPRPLAREMYQVGNRPGHYQAFMSLVHHWPSWEAVGTRYGDIDRPVMLLYGDHDWSRPEERERNARRIPGAELRTVAEAGHFLSLDAPDDMIAHVTEFVDRLPAAPVAQRASG